MSDAMSKDERCIGCYYEERSYNVPPCNECLRAFSGNQKDWYIEDKPGACIEVPKGKTLEEVVAFSKKEKPCEQEFLTKLIDDHWAYIEKLLFAHDSVPEDVKMCEFHYKSAFEHGWKHCREYMEGK